MTDNELYFKMTLEEMVESLQKLNWDKLVDTIKDLQYIFESFYEDRVKQLNEEYDKQIAEHKAKLNKNQDECNEMWLKRLREENALLYKENNMLRERVAYFESLVKNNAK